MSKVNSKPQAIPFEVERSLKKLGEDIRVARNGRKASQKNWAERIGVSVATIRRMEQGDPSVSMAVYASALWLCNRSNHLAHLMDPIADKELWAVRTLRQK